MAVKSANRVLEILEYFAEVRAPASLTQLAEALALPKSSCLALIGTLEETGYLYQVHPRVGYYPTGRWLEQAQVIAQHDPVIHRVSPAMEALRDRTGETVILGKQAGHRVVYIAVVESSQTVRYTAHPGQFKPLHGTSSGKALLATLDGDLRRQLLRELTLKSFTPRTITGIAAIERDLAAGIRRGWHCSVGEHVPDVTALAATFAVNDEAYVLVVAGPSHRLATRLDETGTALVRTCREIADAAPAARAPQGRT